MKNLFLISLIVTSTMSFGGSINHIFVEGNETEEIQEVVNIAYEKCHTIYGGTVVNMPQIQADHEYDEESEKIKSLYSVTVSCGSH
jgi:hypothetical protein